MKYIEFERVKNGVYFVKDRATGSNLGTMSNCSNQWVFSPYESESFTADGMEEIAQKLRELNAQETP